MFEAAHDRLRAALAVAATRPPRRPPETATDAAPPATGRRAGPPRAGPVPRARQRADRRRPGEGGRGGGHQAGHRGDHRRRPGGAADDPDRPDYVSRGGHKLAGALAVVRAAGPAGARAAGASTPARRPAGSPTCCCAPGAAEVVAVDVGYGQLAWSLRSDERVVVHDRTNIRDLTLDLVGGPVDLVVGDLSFISLELVLDALVAGDRRRRRPGADGQAAVRGRQGPGRQGRRRARPRPARATAVAAVADAPRGAAGGRRPSPPARCPARPATSSTSCGCATAAARSATRRDPRRGTSYRGPGGCPVRGWGRDQPRDPPRRTAASW